MVTRALNKVQYGYQGKNGVFSDFTKHTCCEIYSILFNAFFGYNVIKSGAVGCAILRWVVL